MGRAYSVSMDDGGSRSRRAGASLTIGEGGGDGRRD
jgi:hypothetical protein